MPFRLIRESPDQARSGRVPYGVTLDVRRLTLGSATDQHVHLPQAGVERHHAVITGSWGGRLQLQVLVSRGVLVNGSRVRRKRLKPGDQISIGSTTILVERPLPNRVSVLRICEGDPQEADAEAPRLESGGGSIRFWSWTLTVAVTILFLLIPLWGLMVPAVGKVLRNTPLLPSDILWNPGPLHASHQVLGAACDACHAKPFAQVRDQECATCHADVQHHVYARSGDTSLFTGQRCASCHREHKQPATLVQSDPRLCTDCHASLEHLKPKPGAGDVTDFVSGHPEFRLSVLASNGAGWRLLRLDRSHPESFAEHSHLRFSHQVHLDPRGIRSGTGDDRVLICQDCHRPDGGGREMLPPRMATDCAGCHSLRFDDQDPTSTLPHGDLKAAYRVLQERFSRRFLEQGTLVAQRERRRLPDLTDTQTSTSGTAIERVDDQALRVMRQIVEKTLCSECHEVTRVPGQTGIDQLRIQPVRLTSLWMPFARFDHGAHIRQKCIECHPAAPTSARAEDILIPKISTCRQCHGGANDSTKVASTCIMCHQFHLPGHGPFLGTAAKRAKAATTPIDPARRMTLPTD